MIEQIIFDHLRRQLEQRVCMEVPEKRPDTFVVVKKTGGGRRNQINSAMLVVQSYADTLLHAAELNETVKAAMEEAAYLRELCSVRLNSDYIFTDVTTKHYRYQAVYDIVYY